MKIKVLFLCFICLFLVSMNLSASTFSSYYPGGKNYLEYDNFNIEDDRINTIDDIKVKSNTTYTLSIPGNGNLEDPYFLIESSTTSYIDNFAENSSFCTYNQDYTVCTFTTRDTDNFISIDLTGNFLGGMFAYYAGQGFQLEEGLTRTEYEEYVIPLIDSNNPEFSGSGAFIISYHDSYDIDEIIANHIVVVDDIDGDISSNIVIVSDDYTQNKHVVGEYLVELQASDQSGNTASFNLTVIVKDEEVPTISGLEILNINVDDNLTIESIINDNYSSVDEYDGTLIITTLFDEFTVSSTIVGNYNVTLTTVDSSGNTATKGILINVVDTQNPTLDSLASINIYMSNLKDISEVLGELEYSDNYSSKNEITLTLLTDNYSSSSEFIGSNNVEIKLEDESHNSTIIVLSLNVIDDIKPVISGPTSYLISYVESYTITEIIELLSVSDNYDDLSNEDITVIQDTYTTRNTEVGTFIVEFKLEDFSLNASTHTVVINVVDDQAPIIYMDDYLVTLSQNVSFTPEDALKILVNNHELSNRTYTTKVLYDEYSGNEHIPGTYLYSLSFTDTEGMILQKDFIVKVAEEQGLLDGSLIVRNIIVYSITILFFGFVVYKNKK